MSNNQKLQIKALRKLEVLAKSSNEGKWNKNG